MSNPDVIMCRRQPGTTIGRLCEKCNGKCPLCDSYVGQHIKVLICDDCNTGTYGARCITCGAPGYADAFYCLECTKAKKNRDGCPKVVNVAESQTDLFYERCRSGFKKD